MGKKSKNPFTEVDVEYTYRGQNFSVMYHDQITSPAYMALSDSAKVMLQICKDTRRFYMKKEGGTYPNAIPYRKGENIVTDDPTAFYMNRALLKLYGRSNPNRARADLQQLVRYGFITVLQLGCNTRTKNIYQYSNKWQGLKEGEQVELKGNDLAFCTYHPRKKKPKDNTES